MENVWQKKVHKYNWWPWEDGEAKPIQEFGGDAHEALTEVGVST